MNSIFATCRSARFLALIATLAVGALSGTASLADGPQCASLVPETAADYYASRGCGLLKGVEQFHLGPAQRHIRERHWTQAMNDLVFIVNQFPNHPHALLLMAQVCEAWPVTDRERGARCNLDRTFERAVDINPKAAGTLIVRGTYEYRAKRYDKAIASYTRAVELDPQSINANYNLGLAYLETKQFEQANASAQRAYALGAPLPGLRKRLEEAGRWKPDPASPAPAAPAPDAGAAPR